MSDEQPIEDTGKRSLTCPCGEHFHEESENALVDVVNAHLKAEHPGHEYSRDQILFMAT